jgi:hypothetical protein
MHKTSCQSVIVDISAKEKETEIKTQESVITPEPTPNMSQRDFNNRCLSALCANGICAVKIPMKNS